MLRTIELVTLGQKSAVCKKCGDVIPAFSEDILNFRMGGQKRCVCKACTEIAPNGRTFSKLSADKRTGKNVHTIMVYTADTAVVLNACVAHDMSSKNLGNGFYRLKITVGSCNKGGWLFDEEAGIASEGCSILVNGIPVHDAHEYHNVVNAQDWYRRVGE